MQHNHKPTNRFNCEPCNDISTNATFVWHGWPFGIPDILLNNTYSDGRRVRIMVKWCVTHRLCRMILRDNIIIIIIIMLNNLRQTMTGAGRPGLAVAAVLPVSVHLEEGKVVVGAQGDGEKCVFTTYYWYKAIMLHKLGVVVV